MQVGSDFFSPFTTATMDGDIQEETDRAIALALADENPVGEKPSSTKVRPTSLVIAVGGREAFA